MGVSGGVCVREGECLMLHTHWATKTSSILIAAQRELIISSALQSQSCEWLVQPSSDRRPTTWSGGDAFSPLVAPLPRLAARH